MIDRLHGAGVGTILTTAQVNDVVAAGAAFGVAPGMNIRVATLAKSVELPFAPGICTPSDIVQALECGCRAMKFFPAEPLGGMAYLKSITAPYAHLGVTFVLLGGIDTDKVEGYLRESSILALGGSWINTAGSHSKAGLGLHRGTGGACLGDC